MESTWIVKDGSDKVIVFVLGWASGPDAVNHIRPEGWDILAVYNYSPVDSEDAVRIIQVVERYPRRMLIAWSFGVWAAEKYFCHIKFERAVALNGTPYPVHVDHGIDPRRMAVTIRGIISAGTEAFGRRTYGDFYDSPDLRLFPRTLNDNIAELEYLADASSRHYLPSIKWDTAVVGTKDLIFPPENMVSYWGVISKSLPLPHYPFGDSNLILGEIDC